MFRSSNFFCLVSKLEPVKQTCLRWKKLPKPNDTIYIKNTGTVLYEFINHFIITVQLVYKKAIIAFLKILFLLQILITLVSLYPVFFLFHSSSESRERAYDHSPYGHHERSGTFDRQRHYNAEYYRDRSLFAAAGPGSSAIGGTFETTDPHFDSRIRDPFTLTNATRRDLYRDDRGRRADRTYHHRRSRSSHSSQSRHPSPQRTPGQTPKTSHSPKRAPLSPGRGPRSQSRSRSSSSDSVSSTSSTGSGRWGIYFMVFPLCLVHLLSGLKHFVRWNSRYVIDSSKCLIIHSSDNSDSNSSSSDGSQARSVQSSAAPAQSSMVLDSEEPRRSFGIKVQNLPVRSTGELLSMFKGNLSNCPLNNSFQCSYVLRPLQFTMLLWSKTWCGASPMSLGVYEADRTVMKYSVMF